MPTYNRARRRHAFSHAFSSLSLPENIWQRNLERQFPAPPTPPPPLPQEMYQAAERDMWRRNWKRTSARRRSYQGVGGAKWGRSREESTEIISKIQKHWCHIEQWINRVLNHSPTNPNPSAPKQGGWRANYSLWTRRPCLSLKKWSWCQTNLSPR